MTCTGMHGGGGNEGARGVNEGARGCIRCCVA